ncbi:hypothetical protein QTO34_004925 [Cnephaeus nilssonii]|uniref:14 kDa phosphohistidine phosphatase n=1 Tax=Cnephaeus nilssonii TaxID=3371016 RepID=A0AA40HNB2_CNENI|nr:hypothetical protein QTO34_004925 [Eptesicus nilssonii]
MAAPDLAQIPDVDIDPDGVFKYVLIRVHAAPAGQSKEIVRGYKWAEYHGEGGAGPRRCGRGPGVGGRGLGVGGRGHRAVGRGRGRPGRGSRAGSGVLGPQGCGGPTPLSSSPRPCPAWGAPLLGSQLLGAGAQTPGSPGRQAEGCPLPAADIYDKVSGEMQQKGYGCECLGGGRISHQSQDKKIHVYGYSMGYGRAQHSISTEKIKARYPDYEVTWADDGY